MTGMKKIESDLLNGVTGGQANVVDNPHEGYAYANCREKPGLDQRVLLEIPNGTEVSITGRIQEKDGIEWYEVNLAGGYEYGWIAGHLIGY